jgi:hypothetical protein
MFALGEFDKSHGSTLRGEKHDTHQRRNRQVRSYRATARDAPTRAERRAAYALGDLLGPRIELEPELEPEPEPEPEPAHDTTRRRARSRRPTDDDPDSGEEVEIWNWHERRTEARTMHDEMMQRIGLIAQNDWENDWEMQHRRRFCSSLFS